MPVLRILLFYKLAKTVVGVFLEKGSVPVPDLCDISGFIVSVGIAVTPDCFLLDQVCGVAGTPPGLLVRIALGRYIRRRRRYAGQAVEAVVGVRICCPVKGRFGQQVVLPVGIALGKAPVRRLKAIFRTL